MSLTHKASMTIMLLLHAQTYTLLIRVFLQFSVLGFYM